MKTKLNLPKVSKNDKKENILNAYNQLLGQLEKDEISVEKVTKKTEQNIQGLKSLAEEHAQNILNTLNQNIDSLFNQLEEVVASTTTIANLKIEKEKEWEEKQSELEKGRKREEDEYAYNFNRKRQKDEDEWQEKRQKRELELSQREELLKQAEEELKDLRNKDKSFDARLEKAIADAVKSNTQDLQKAYDNGVKLTNQQYEAEKNLLLAKIDSLTSITESQKNEVNRLNKQIDDANRRLTEIAIGAVKGYKNPPKDESTQ